MMSDESVWPWAGGIATSGRGRRRSIIAPFAEGEGASMHSATTPTSAQRAAPRVRRDRNETMQTPLLMRFVAITDAVPFVSVRTLAFSARRRGACAPESHAD